MNSQYDTAQICLMGHVINSSSERNSEDNKSFCDRCGQPTIRECPNCKYPIRGQAHPTPGQWVVVGNFPTPKYCENCGEPYPWTAGAIRAARDLALEQDTLSEEEKEQLAESIEDLVKETPATSVAKIRFVKLMKKLGQSSADAFRDILVNIVTESVRRSLWP